MPATTAIGDEAKTPQNNLKTRKAGQLGARAQAIVKIVKAPSVKYVSILRPRCSLNGAQIKGPKTYPIKKMEIGKTFCSDDLTPNSAVMNGTAILGRADAIVEFRTSIAVISVAKLFFHYEHC